MPCRWCQQDAVMFVVTHELDRTLLAVTYLCDHHSIGAHMAIQYDRRAISEGLKRIDAVIGAVT